MQINYPKLMNITILNGDPESGDTDFSRWIEKLAKLYETDNNVKVFRLSDMQLHYCIGCWTCWWETPGICIHKDDAPEVFKAVINSDFFIFASPLIAGFTSALLKKITDRLIVLIHPYMIVKQDESHHRKRYDNYPDFGLILQKEAETDEEDLQIVKDIYDRLSVNFHSKLRFMKLTDQHQPEDIVYATHHF